MELGVSRQIRFLWEGLPAMTAFKRFDSRVYPRVTVQVRLSRESLWAQRAFKRALPGVNAHAGRIK